MSGPISGSSSGPAPEARRLDRDDQHILGAKRPGIIRLDVADELLALFAEQQALGANQLQRIAASEDADGLTGNRQLRRDPSSDGAGPDDCDLGDPAVKGA